MIYAIFIILFKEENKKYHVFTKAFTFYIVRSFWMTQEYLYILCITMTVYRICLSQLFHNKEHWGKVFFKYVFHSYTEYSKNPIKTCQLKNKLAVKCTTKYAIWIIKKSYKFAQNPSRSLLGVESMKVSK